MMMSLGRVDVVISSFLDRLRKCGGRSWRRQTFFLEGSITHNEQRKEKDN